MGVGGLPAGGAPPVWPTGIVPPLGRLTRTGGLFDLYTPDGELGLPLPILRDRSSSGSCVVPTTRSPFAMNRRVKRQILIALGVFAGIILIFVLIAQLGA